MYTSTSYTQTHTQSKKYVFIAQILLTRTAVGQVCNAKPGQGDCGDNCMHGHPKTQQWIVRETQLCSPKVQDRVGPVFTDEWAGV